MYNQQLELPFGNQTWLAEKSLVYREVYIWEIHLEIGDFKACHVCLLRQGRTLWHYQLHPKLDSFLVVFLRGCYKDYESLAFVFQSSLGYIYNSRNWQLIVYRHVGYFQNAQGNPKRWDNLKVMSI